MKKNLFIATLALAVVLVSASAKAASTPSASTGGMKIGYVDFNRALNETTEGKTAKNTLTSEFKERQQKLDIVQNELKSMKEELDKQRLILSADALKTKEEKYRDKFLELQQKLGTFKQEMAQKEATLTEGLLKKLKTIVRDIGQKENYTVILEKSQEVVLYSPDADDLTDRVIKICNSSK
jgi:outer membrane protein